MASMSAERPILLVDDDVTLRETLVEQLELDREFAAAQAGSVSEAEKLLAGPDARFDALILDVTLPDDPAVAAVVRRSAVETAGGPRPVLVCD